DEGAATPLPRAPRLDVRGARRRIAGVVLTLLGLMAITAALAPEAGVLGLGASGAPQVAADALTTPLLLYLALTAGVAAVGGLWPGLTCAVAGVVLGNAVFTQPRGSLTVHSADDVVALVVFLLISTLVSTLADLVARRAAQTARARAEVRVLTRLAATIPAVADPLARLTEEIKDLFDLDGVALVRRDEDDRWVLECATGDAPTLPGQADDQLRVDAQRLLLLRGPRAPAEDRRLLAAVVTQLAVASTRRSLTEATTALREANAANDLRTALLSAVSHDLRTPLASIKAAASSMLADDVELSPDLIGQFAQAIVADSDRLNRLVTNLLDMSRLQAGATHPLMEPVGIDEVVVLALDQTPARLVELRIPGDLPDVWADPALLERVLANLIDNAIKASLGMRVLIWVARIPEGVMISIIDHGVGIPADAVDGVFQPFQRLGDAPKGRGVGLGLAIAKGFTDAMGGELRVEPTPGGGTTMRLTLPFATSPAGRSASRVGAHG
ncbi:MAG TPA: ATP-binding protein, partial [Euzebya sp.]|nr:ATP-binding protein [Euzebya sp.]